MADYFDYEEEYDLDGELLPCEFCDELFPSGILIEHQTGCQFAVFGVQTKEEQMEEAPETNTSKNDKFSQQVQLAKGAGTENTTDKKVSKLNKNTYSTVRLNVQDDDYGQENSEAGENVRSNNRGAFSTMDSSSVSPAKLNNTVIQSNQENCGEMNEYVLSDDDDDAFESIESFWKQAAVILKNRLAANNVEDKMCDNIYEISSLFKPFAKAILFHKEVEKAIRKKERKLVKLKQDFNKQNNRRKDNSKTKYKERY